MKQNEIKRITGLSLYLESDQFYQHIKTSDFRNFLLENTEFISSLILEAYQISTHLSHQTLEGNKKIMSQGEAIKSNHNTHSAPIEIKDVKEQPQKSFPVINGLNLELIENDVLETVCAQTGYPRDMVEFDIDLEADLGVDTVKKMEIIADLAEKYKLQFRKDFNITNLSTVRSISNLIYEDSQSQNART